MTSPSSSRVTIGVPNWVGDAVMALPALFELRRIFSDAQITLSARSWVAGLLDGEGLADTLMPIHEARGAFQKAGNFIRETRRLGRERFDLAVLFQNSFGAALVARVAGIKKIVGYPTDGRGPLLDLVVPFEPDYKTAHQVRYYLNIAATIEQELTGQSRVNFERPPRLRVSDDLRNFGSRIIRSKRIGNHELTAAASPILVLSPGATNSRAKRWLAERFASTADRIAERNGFQTVIVGTAADVEVANEVAALMTTEPLVLAGRTSIAELKAILACTSLVISNDTGTAHVSAALGVPTVVVFGPTEHFATSPFSDASTVVRHDVECSPCMLRECPIDHRCMTRVEVDDVYAAAQSLLINANG